MVSDHPADGGVPLVGQRAGRRQGVIAGERDRCPGAPCAVGLDPYPGVGLQVADVVGLCPVRGDKPEDVAVQAIPHRGVPCQPGAAAGRLQQGERTRRNPCSQGEATSPPLRKRSIWLRPRGIPTPRPPVPAARSASGFHWNGVSVMDSSGSSGQFAAIVVPWSRSAAPWPALNADCTGTEARSRPGAATAITSIACSRFTVTWTRLCCPEARG